MTAARAKLSNHLIQLQAAGAPLPPPTLPIAPTTETTTTSGGEPPIPAPRLLELLAKADASAPAPFLEERRKKAAAAADFAAASRQVQALFCDLLRLDGFGKALSYDSDRVEDELGTTAQIRAWAEAPDLDIALGAQITLPHDAGLLVVKNVRAGLKRKSLNRAAEVSIEVHESPDGAALYTNEVYAAFTSLVDQVSLAAEAAREPDPPPEPTHTTWEAINDLYDRVEALESRTGASPTTEVAGTRD